MRANERTPYHFRPMDELTAEGREVEMALRDTGEVIIGLLFCGHPMVARTFWTRGPRGTSCIEPIGWRDVPTQEIVAAWKAAEAERVAA
jgi:hypothetical protein